MKTAFAMDLGNGYVKAQNNKRQVIAPSMIANKNSLGFSSVAALLNPEETAYQEFNSPMDDSNTYIWGEGILQAVEAESLIATYTHNDRYNQKRFKLLCSFVLAELASDFSDEELTDVVLVTGLPSQEIGTEDEQKLKTFLQQKHIVTRDGVQRLINVTDVRVVEQPLGTLLDVYMNDEGNIHKDLLTNTITMLDFGAGTTIMDTFKNFKRLPEKSETFYEGMNDLHRIIAKQLEAQHSIKGLDTTLIDNGFRRGDLIADLSERKKYPFEDIATNVVPNFVDKRLVEVDRTLTNRDSVDKFIVTGGGANVVKEYFLQVFNESNIKVIEDSQTANLRGFFKLASQLSK